MAAPGGGIDINLQAMLASRANAGMQQSGAGAGSFGWEQPFKTILEVMNEMMGMTMGAFKMVSDGLNGILHGFMPKSPMTGLSLQGVVMVGQLPGMHPASHLPGFFNGKGGAGAHH